MLVYECPICHNKTLTEVAPQSGNSFIITEVNTDTKEFMSTSGFPVRLMGCASCNTVLMRNDTMEIQYPN